MSTQLSWTDPSEEGAAPTDEGRTFVDVAVDVPLRRTFTYRVPASLEGALVPGQRVAVPFAGRKTVGVVLGGAEAPEGVRRIHALAGVLEREPVFPAELFAFLRRAADYYLAPVGEVLRAAAPALPRDALRRLKAAGFLADAESLPGSAVATRKEVFVTRVAGRDPGRLGARQHAVWEALGGGEPVAYARLRDTAGATREVLRGLEAKGLVLAEEREVLADPFFEGEVVRDTPKTPTPEQGEAIGAMTARLAVGEGGGFLLEGVTGSGKTEVYLQIIDAARRLGKGALVLVPEIALTPQLVSRFRARFGDAIAVLHSGLTDRARADAWAALRAGATHLAVGARSALFAPVPNLGIVVVDEEHDASFKQEEGFRYHARDMALLRAQGAGALCVLGSATPAVETRWLAMEGRLTHCRLRARAMGQALPAVEIVDLTRHRVGPSGARLFSAPLHRGLEACLAEGGQAILFLNRRGFAPSVRCEACGVVAECPTCSVALTLHRGAGLLRCHYCDFARADVEVCAACGAREIAQLGLGTEKLEASLAETFPSARIGRLDRDTAGTAGSAEHVLERFRRRELDVLVGTQMVTKGHDLPGVTLVGVVLADQSLAFPDFRASERTFQLLSQVAGRAGRGERPGRVLFQTFQPHHAAITAAAAHDYEAFFARELEERRELGYPPFSRVATVRVDAGDPAVAEQTAASLAALAREVPAAREGKVLVLGPAPAPIQRLRGRYRHRLLLRAGSRPALRAVAEVLADAIERGVAPARASLDIDPVSTL